MYNLHMSVACHRSGESKQTNYLFGEMWAGREKKVSEKWVVFIFTQQWNGRIRLTFQRDLNKFGKLVFFVVSIHLDSRHYLFKPEDKKWSRHLYNIAPHSLLSVLFFLSVFVKSCRVSSGGGGERPKGLVHLYLFLCSLWSIPVSLSYLLFSILKENGERARPVFRFGGSKASKTVYNM